MVLLLEHVVVLVVVAVVLLLTPAGLKGCNAQQQQQQQVQYHGNNKTSSLSFSGCQHLWSIFTLKLNERSTHGAILRGEFVDDFEKPHPLYSIHGSGRSTNNRNNNNNDEDKVLLPTPQQSQSQLQSQQHGMLAMMNEPHFSVFKRSCSAHVCDIADPAYWPQLLGPSSDHVCNPHGIRQTDNEVNTSIQDSGKAKTRRAEETDTVATVPSSCANPPSVQCTVSCIADTINTGDHVITLDMTRGCRLILVFPDFQDSVISNGALDMLASLPFTELSLHQYPTQGQLGDVFNDITWPYVTYIDISTLNVPSISDIVIKAPLKTLRLLGRSAVQRGQFGDFPLQLPPSIETIILNYNAMSEIYLGRGQPQLLYPNLTHLSISYSSLTTVPEALSVYFPKLQRFSLNQSPLEDSAAVFRALEGLTSLQRLDITACNLTYIPDNALHGHTQLTHFDVDTNFIDKLPATLFLRSTKLVEFVINRNALLTLPATLFDTITLLEVFMASDNRLVSLPEDLFEHTVNLKEIYISRNRLERLPDALFQNTPELETVFADTNQLSFIPATLFENTPRLSELVMSENVITSIPPTLFHNCGGLHEVHLSDNRISWIDRRVFQYTTQLEQLRMNENNLRSLDRGAFAHITQVREIFLFENRLQEIDNAFEGGVFPLLYSLVLDYNDLTVFPRTLIDKTPGLQFLRLKGNRLRRLDAGVFGNITSISRLDISQNQLTYIAPGTFLSIARLTAVILSRNNLRALEGRWFADNSAVIRFTCAGCGIQSIDDKVLSNLPNLQVLELRDNELTTLPDGMIAMSSGLHRLEVAENYLTQLPHGVLSASSKLITLNVGDNHLTKFPAQALQRPDLLEELFLQQRGGYSLELEGNFTSPLTSLMRVFAVGIRFQVSSLLELGIRALSVFSFGWIGANEDTFDLPALCNLFGTRVEILEIRGTGFKNMELCRQRRLHFESLVITGNHQLTAVTVGGTVTISTLNVSSNPLLQQVSHTSVPVFDASGTSLVYSSELCTKYGYQAFFASAMHTPSLRSSIRQLLDSCLLNVQILDVSHNDWLNDVSIWGSLHRDPVLIVTEQEFVREYFSNDGLILATRNTLPVLELAGIPISCDRHVFGLMVSSFEGSGTVSSVAVGFTISCRCSSGFTSSGGSNACKQATLSVAELAGIVSGSVLFGLLVWPLVFLLYRRHQARKAYQLELESFCELQQHLLTERDQEVMELKRVWEIGANELKFMRRIDGDSKGAFGEVWKCQWDTIFVAVKVLKESLMTLDEETIAEFGKEVEFLRRTRHPHVVRFFGAGQMDNGSPFLVLELVSLGSLSSLLWHGRLSPALADLQKKKEPHSSRNQAIPASLWDLKVRLATDIALGMQFIHSVNEIHRDLKSGNVLITAELRAKITDFGSIRNCFTPTKPVTSTPSTATSTNTSTTSFNTNANSRKSLASTPSSSLSSGPNTGVVRRPVLNRTSLLGDSKVA